MRTDFPLFPDSASTISPHVDLLYFALVAVCGLVSLLILVLILTFAIKYRRRPGNEVAIEYEPYLWVEWSWIIIPFFIFMGMFLWGAQVFFRMSRVPDNAMDVYVTGKQWMWRFQHLGGQSEINELHVPVGRPVRLTMASEDVIHSLYFPAFRVKTDVIPSRYSVNWFQATRTGSFNLFCTEYCGTWHSRMIGRVHVLSASDYQTWLSGGAVDMSPAQAGEQLFEQFACNTCHSADSGARGPALDGIFGTMVRLTDGRTVRADENYIRESIMNPAAKIVDGYQPLMPTFQGQLDEQQLLHILAYIKSLSPAALQSHPTQRGRRNDHRRDRRHATS